MLISKPSSSLVFICASLSNDHLFSPSDQSMHQMSKSSTGGSSNISENVGAGVVQISPATQKEDLPTEGVGNAVSIIDQQCLKLSTVLVPCFNFCREAGVLGIYFLCLYPFHGLHCHHL